jgi:hypothetical protein
MSDTEQSTESKETTASEESPATEESAGAADTAAADTAAEDTAAEDAASALATGDETAAAADAPEAGDAPAPEAAAGGEKTSAPEAPAAAAETSATEAPAEAEEPAGGEAAPAAETAPEPSAEAAAPAGASPQHTYEELKGKTVVQMREIAEGLGEHDALHGYTTMHKEELLVALCAALGIEAHEHHEVVGIDKTKVKSKIRELKKQRDALVEAKDSKQLKIVRARIRRLKRKIHKATV